MKVLNKKIIKVFLGTFIFLFFIVGKAYAMDKVMESETINDVNKVWTVKFNKAIDFTSTKRNIWVSSLKNNVIITENIEKVDDRTVRIKPPVNGYKIGESYKIVIRDSIKPKKGNGLKKQVAKEFKVVEKKEFTASASVMVSPYMPMFKGVKIKCDTMPEIKKFKVEDYDTLYEMGKDNVMILTGSNVKIVFYKEDGVTKVGEGTLDVSKDNDNAEIVCQ
ncbi:hypothetical protein CLOACE_14870 [Clostridium acetireducens DSM 10703]|jgi:hypothetical protein|uniref:SbsA Ig-like domain-containing protein n=1 Tax=Clostridium acetireducens DSM 10703 TaxID=1121290 RepID=A0A1E8EY40_9CLOT|nr:Ig-like domain-containing protein [Clostridium acetireducens]OFI05869.1 hypothetical protein CLOACE_14870 [Clostridium acetireducens DSM 10703]